jgi:hypothetical protein
MVMYRPRISSPWIFSSFLDRYPECYARFKGLYFYIDYPGSTKEFREAKKQWIGLFNRLGRDCGYVDHVEVCWGRYWVTDSPDSHKNPLGIDKEVLIALGSIKVKKYVRVLGDYEKSICVNCLEDDMGVDNDEWVGFCWH